MHSLKTTFKTVIFISVPKDIFMFFMPSGLFLQQFYDSEAQKKDGFKDQFHFIPDVNC